MDELGVVGMHETSLGFEDMGLVGKGVNCSCGSSLENWCCGLKRRC